MACSLVEEWAQKCPDPYNSIQGWSLGGSTRKGRQNEAKTDRPNKDKVDGR